MTLPPQPLPAFTNTDVSSDGVFSGEFDVQPNAVLGHVGLHVTTAGALGPIVRQGIVPRVGPRAMQDGTVKAAVCLFRREVDADWVDSSFDKNEELFILRIDLEGLWIADGAKANEALCHVTIDHSRILSIDAYSDRPTAGRKNRL